MDSSFNYNHHSLFFMNDFDHHQQEEKSGSESPPSTANLNNHHHYTSKLIPSSSPSKKSRRGIQKRVVTVPMKEVEGSRLKGEISNNGPPSDSWAWRKYGQKPIKGSPYPRGYYRCSSSKGCPARKQVERSRVDPTLLLITYSAEHNHPGPTSRNNNTHHSSSSAVSAVTAAASRPTCKTQTINNNNNNNGIPDPVPQHEEKFADLGDESLIVTCDEFSWFRDMETTSSTILECPIFAEERNAFFPMREEDESLFADLGELPECSIVLRSGGPTDRDVDPRPHYVGPRAEILGHVSF